MIYHFLTPSQFLNHSVSVAPDPPFTTGLTRRSYSSKLVAVRGHVAADETGSGSMMNNINPMLLSIQNKTYMLTGRPRGRRDASSVLAEFLGVLDGLDTEVKAVYHYRVELSIV